MVNSIGELLGHIFIGDIFQKAIVIYHANLIFSELHEFKECLKNKENVADECGIGKARLLVIPCVHALKMRGHLCWQQEPLSFSSAPSVVP